MVAFTSLVALFSGALPAVMAQSSASSAAAPVSTSSIPACAVSCTISTLPSSPCAAYGITNLTCICTSTDFQSAFYNCQATTCSPADLGAAEAYGASACQNNGTPINITAIPTGVTAGSAASSTPAASSTSSSAPVSSSSSKASSTSAAATGSAAPAATSAKSAAIKNVLGATGIVASILGGLALLF